jgi:hypothetical protein
MEVLLDDRGSGAVERLAVNGQIERGDQEKHSDDAEREENPFPGCREIAMVRLGDSGAGTGLDVSH